MKLPRSWRYGALRSDGHFFRHGQLCVYRDYRRRDEPSLGHVTHAGVSRDTGQ